MVQVASVSRISHLSHTVYFVCTQVYLSRWLPEIPSNYPLLEIDFLVGIRCSAYVVFISWMEKWTRLQESFSKWEDSCLLTLSTSLVSCWRDCQ